MPDEYIMWIIGAGVVGLVLGFLAAYLFLKRSTVSHRDELTALRGSVDERQNRLEEAETRMRSLNKRIEDKEHQLEAARNEIYQLERTLEEKALREKKALSALRDAFHEDVRTEEVRSADSDEAHRRAEAAEERRRAETLSTVERAEARTEDIANKNRR